MEIVSVLEVCPGREGAAAASCIRSIEKSGQMARPIISRSESEHPHALLKFVSWIAKKQKKLHLQALGQTTERARREVDGM
jgi:hypothetical protein